MDTYLQLPIEKKNFVTISGFWIVVHPVIWLNNLCGSKILVQNESNGKAERANRVLLERAKSLLYESKLPLKFWAEAINCSTQVSNVTPQKGKKNLIRNLDRPGEIENDNSIPLQTTSSPRTGRIQIPVLELNDVQNQIPVRRSERLKSKLMSVHLVNNVPNSYFEAENSADWKNWKLAMENELDSLDKHKVWEIVQKPAKSKLIKTKWSYSPVVNIESFRLLIALAAKLKLNVNFFDVKTAYLYGDLEETVYVLPPPGYEKLIGDDKVCKLKKRIYGLPQSGRNCCEVAGLPRKPKPADSIPAGFDTFSESERCGHACYTIMWHLKDPVSSFDPGALSKTKSH
ncbi:retrovirus-related Pol polyprotein from transposon TNT 1-94 [Trichonephila clavipes]|uniref:Retrovirus-related Pol polyprotein from transposon TNT 1-94 n=1 Tax=Trichonephila clavipes TaxID=2585209 RepID=A0A8X7BK23_TRICX|nr:retrovirus-related Pol polyprotein from transposon TNT 1-94 [Trichonephila clavipes]